MGRIPGIPHQRAVKAFEKAGFRIAGKGSPRIITIPRHDPIDAYSMGGIVRDAGLSADQFRKLL